MSTGNCKNVLVCGRTFSPGDLASIRECISGSPSRSRREIATRTCELLGWLTPAGRLKEMSCRVAMIRMQRDGLINLPPPTRRAPTQYRVVISPQSDPMPDIYCVVNSLVDLRIEPVNGQKSLRLWNQFIARYHYLGYRMLPCL